MLLWGLRTRWPRVNNMFVADGMHILDLYGISREVQWRAKAKDKRNKIRDLGVNKTFMRANKRRNGSLRRMPTETCRKKVTRQIRDPNRATGMIDQVTFIVVETGPTGNTGITFLFSSATILAGVHSPHLYMPVSTELSRCLIRITYECSMDALLICQFTITAFVTATLVVIG